MSANTVHSVLLAAGERMLILPAAALGSVMAPNLLQPGPPGGIAELVGEVSSGGTSIPVLSAERMVGAEAQPVNNRCRIALLRLPDSERELGVLVRAYPLVVSVTPEAFRRRDHPEILPAYGFLGAGQIGRRAVLLPDLEAWLRRIDGEVDTGASASPQQHG